MLASALLLGLVATTATARHCVNLTIPLSLEARNGVFDLAVPKTEIEVTDFLLDFTRSGRNFTKTVTTGYKTVRGDYQIGATYCEPARGGRNTLHIATHGIGFDRSYWDFPHNNYNYSYVNRALDQGYSVLAWDRPGIGKSTHGDALTEMQIFLQVAALRGLTQWVKDGNLEKGKHAESKIVHIGHSYGSAVTLAMTDEFPGLSDGIILTGFSQVTSFVGQFLLGANFVSVKGVKPLAEKYGEGYFGAKSPVGLHINFFAPHDFDPEILTMATKTGQPAGVGEILTIGSVPPTSTFGGPVLIVTGERDVPFCGGDCSNTRPISNSAPDLLQMSKKSFYSASTFKTAIIPGAGHGLNYQYSHPLTYRAMLDFVKANV